MVLSCQYIFSDTIYNVAFAHQLLSFAELQNKLLNVIVINSK